MRYLLIFLLLNASGTAWAAELFLTTAPASATPTERTEDAQAPELSPADRQWIDSVARVLEPVAVDSLDFIDTGAGQAAATVWAERTEWQTGGLPREGLAAAAQRLLRTEENRLLVLDREAMQTVYQALDHDISGIRLSDESLVHHLRIHDGRLVSVLFWRVRANAELSDEQ